MKALKFPLLIGAVLLACNTNVIAQADVHFSQFYEHATLRNPGLIGIFSQDFKVGASYREQWSSISKPFVTALGYGEARFSVGKVSDDFFSIGLLAFTDKAGSVDQRITAVYPAVNYNKSLNPEKNSYLSLGFTGGYNQYDFDLTKATFNNQYQFGFFSQSSPTFEHIDNTKMSMWDLGTGLNFNTNAGEFNQVTYMVGISGYHLTRPKFSYFDVSSVTENIRWNGNAAAGFDVDDNMVVYVHANYAKQGTYTEIMAGGLFSWSEANAGRRPDYVLTGGLFYRYGDALIPVLKVKYKNVSVGASYDVNVSKLKPASNLRGGYELSMSILSDFTDKNAAAKKTVCPKF